MISLEQYRKSAELLRRGRKVYASCMTREQQLVALQYWYRICRWHQKNRMPLSLGTEASPLMPSNEGCAVGSHVGGAHLPEKLEGWMQTTAEDRLHPQ
ncbi:MAG: hypothetical protein K9L68_14635 [Spirochaetales bacterium]|nr:hypothetical protein [Spirochaetales bacterium]